MNAAVRLVRLLRGKGLTVTTAESMTGGLIAGAITSVPGASEVLSLALCTYSNEAKRRFLGVSASTIAAHTEISAPCAREMARGAAALAGADLALSVTGLAGANTRRTPVAPGSPDDGTGVRGVGGRGDARAARARTSAGRLVGRRWSWLAAPRKRYAEAALPPRRTNKSEGSCNAADGAFCRHC